MDSLTAALNDETTLRRIPGRDLSPGPWGSSADGTLTDANKRGVLVLGYPEDPMSDQDCTNGAFLITTPKMVEFIRMVARFTEASDPEDAIDTVNSLIRHATAIQASWDGC